MDNKAFNNQSNQDDQNKEVIQAPTEPFTDKIIRDAFLNISTNGYTYKSIADELNKVAHNFYSKK